MDFQSKGIELSGELILFLQMSQHHLSRRWTVNVECLTVHAVNPGSDDRMNRVTGDCTVVRLQLTELLLFFSLKCFVARSFLPKLFSLLKGAWKVKLLSNSLGGRQPPCHEGVLVAHLVFDLLHSFIYLKKTKKKTSFCLLHSVLNRRSFRVLTEGFLLKQKTPLPRVHTQTVCIAHVGQTWKNWFMW